MRRLGLVAEAEAEAEREMETEAEAEAEAEAEVIGGVTTGLVTADAEGSDIRVWRGGQVTSKIAGGGISDDGLFLFLFIFCWGWGLGVATGVGVGLARVES